MVSDPTSENEEKSESLPKAPKSEVRPVPVEALKRFAEDLKNDDIGGRRFLRDNMGRVDEFINKPNRISLPKLTGAELEAQQEQERLHREKEKTIRRNARNRGLYSYTPSTISAKNDNVLLQRQPEFSTALGPRSRFGEGDGGYFDRWLNTDERISSFRRHTDESKEMNGIVQPPRSGFKQHFARTTGSPRKSEYELVRPYAQRRAERLQRERGEDDVVEALGHGKGNFVRDGMDDDLSFTQNDTIRRAPEESESAEKAPPYLTLPQLGPDEASVYFGSKARVAFFDFYRQMGEARRSTVSGSALNFLDNGDNDDVESKVKLPEQLTEAEKRYGKKPVKEKKTKKAVVVDEDALYLEEFMQSGLQNPPPNTASIDKYHLDPPIVKRADGDPEVLPGFFRPASARSRFIAACIESNTGPKPSLVMRKGVTSTLSLRGQCMGDDLALNLSIALEVMPYLQHLDLASNCLTDKGLLPILRSLSTCGSLQGLDLSDNKCGPAVMQGLSDMLLNEDEECFVQKLILQQCNITDAELKDFMRLIGVKTHLNHLDLSRNKLGAPGTLALSDGSVGVQALASVIAHPSCNLETLVLAWNSMHNSFDLLANAIKDNKSLTSLDLSFNALEAEGEVLGAALQENRALTSLNLSSNKLKARSVFTLVSAAYECPSLADLDLSGNPVGAQGATLVLKTMNRLGRRVRLGLDGCSVKAIDPSASFNIEEPIGKHVLKMNVPYERACCMELLRTVAENESLFIKDFSIDGDVIELERVIGNIESRSKEVTREPVSNTVDAKETDPNPVLSDAERLQHIDIDIAAAAQLFSKSGATKMSATDLEDLFSHMGMQDAEAKMHAADLMRLYDMNCSGAIDLPEFRSYLADVKLRRDIEKKNAAVCGADEQFYMVMKGTKSPKVYKAPQEGTVTVTVAATLKLVEHVKAPRNEAITDVILMSRASSESHTIMELFARSINLQYVDACTVYRLLIKEGVSRVQALTTLLPVIRNPTDARALLLHANLFSIGEVSEVKFRLGPFYRISLGVYDGFYLLDLGKASDRSCMYRLLELDSFVAQTRKKLDLGDTSEKGNWSSFRNVVLNGEAFKINSDSGDCEDGVPLWGQSLPPDGTIFFDYVYALDESRSEFCTTIPMEKLHKVLVTVGCVAEELESVSALSKAIEAAEAHSTPPIATAEDARQCWTVARQLQQEQQLIDRTSKVKYNREQYFQRVSAEELAWAAEGQRLLRKEELRTRPGTALAEEKQESKDSEQRNEEVRDGLSKSFQEHIKLLEMCLSGHPTNTEVMAIVAARRMDMLLHSLCARYLTCAQLSIIVKTFPGGSLWFQPQKHTEDGADSSPAEADAASEQTEPSGGGVAYSCFRVEIIVTMFAQLVDRVNFSSVLSALTTPEVGMLFTRLGVLNVLSSVRPPQHVHLDLSKRDQKQYFRVLLVLNQHEKSWDDTGCRYDTDEQCEAEVQATGTKKLQKATDEEEGDHEVVLSPAQRVPPSMWVTESIIPSSGRLSLQVDPPTESAGTSKAIREVIMAAVLAGNLHGIGAKRGTISDADKVAEMEELKLSFQLHKQVELLTKKAED